MRIVGAAKGRNKLARIAAVVAAVILFGTVAARTLADERQRRKF